MVLDQFTNAYSKDMNGDRISGKELLYVPKSASEIQFAPVTLVSTVDGMATSNTYTPEQQ